MNARSDHSGDDENTAGTVRRPRALVLLAVILYAEAGLLWAAVVWRILERVFATPPTQAPALAHSVLALIAPPRVTPHAGNTFRR
ncbi:MAG: hypothetical protein LH624_09740, partial [Cryobacterium sp.]|nr:hypothetical protein [Cryobacterium sp.]